MFGIDGMMCLAKYFLYNKQIIIRTKLIILYFTRRRINSSERNSFVDGLGNIFDDDDDGITKGSKKH